MIKFANTKSKIIALATVGVVAVGGVAFGFRDQFLSDKSLYMKVEKENINLILEKINEVEEEDLLGMFFADGSNKSITKSDISLEISGNDGLSGKIANFFNSLKLSITDEVISKEDYKNKKIAFLHDNEELVSLNIVNDEDTVGISVPKLYDKWIVSDMSLAEVISDIIKSDEGTGTTNTLSIGEIKSVFKLSKVEKQDLSNSLNYYLDKVEKILGNVVFTKIEDNNMVYDDNHEFNCDSLKLELSEIETLARLRQMLSKAKESGQIIDFVYDKVEEIKQAHGEKNILTDYVPEKKEVLAKINKWIETIDEKLLELNIEDISVLFDEKDNYIGIEGVEDKYYSMVIYFDRDYKILKREIYSPDSKEATYEIVCVDNDDSRFYSIKTPNKAIEDRVTLDGSISTHNLSKSYYKETYSFEGFKLTKVKKWIDAERFLTIQIDSSNKNQKIISVELPSLEKLKIKLFADISREQVGKNEVNVITKIGLQTKDEKQYLVISKNILRKANVSKLDIYSNSININEQTQEKLDAIVNVIKGNTDGLVQTINDKTGVDVTSVFETIKGVPQKAIDTYKSLNALGIIGR